MVVPDPPLSRKQDKDDVVLIASTHSPTPSQRFSQFKGCSSSLTSQGDSAISDEDIVTNTETSHLSNLALFARNKTPSESVWTNNYSRYSKVRTGSQRSSNSCLRKSIRNKNLKFDVKYGIACAIPELYDKDTYSCQDSEYSYSDTPESYSNHNISVGVNGFLSSSRYKTSNFPLISVGKGLQHQVGEGQGTQFYQSAYNTQDLPEPSSVASGSSKKSWKNKNSKLKKEEFSASRTESVKPFFCLYGKIIHTDDCKCLKINLWKRCLLPGCHLDKVSNTVTFGNIYQNNLDEDVYDVDKHVSSLSEEITADTSIAVFRPKSVTESIHSGQSCTQKLEPVCESAKETDNQLIQYGLETDWGIGEEITQQNNSEIADLRVFSPETALPLRHQTPNYSSREESQSPFVSESESLKVEHFRHTYDNVKNLPFESDTSALLKGTEQVTEPSPSSAWSEATAGLTQGLYNVADFVQYTQTKNNIKSSERPAKQNHLESCLALFDNLLIDIDDPLERKVPHTSENSIAEQLGLYPWAALNSQSIATMASQGKKNKNQFVRKAAPASPVNNTGEGGSSRFSFTNVTSKGLAEVSVDCSSHCTSQKDMNVTNKIELTQGSPPEFGLEQHGIPPDAGVGDAPHILGQSSSLGCISTPSVNIQYSEQSSSVPRIHSHPYSSPSTGSTMHSAYSDSTGKYGTPNHDKTQSLVPPAKPPRTFLSDTMGQHSASSIHKDTQLGSAQIFSNAKQQQSSRLQRQDSQQFANNFDDDGQGYLGQLATDNPLTASDEDIQFNEYLEEQARREYEGPEILLSSGQTGNSNQSTYLQTQVGQNFPFHMNAQEQGQYPSGHLANKTHYSSKEHKQSGHHKGSIPRVPNAGKMGQTSSSHLDNWMDEIQIGQNGGQMEQQQSWQHRGYHGDGQQERLRQMPGTEHGRSLQPAQKGLNDGIVGPMHPHAQLNEMQLNEQDFKENVQGVQNRQRSKAQDCNIPKDHRHGNDQNEGVSDYTRKSTYSSDRELAQEQFDQRMNNPWFQEMVQNIEELAEREGLIIKDVFPDGNCLFTAVIDQLRVRGNFKYTPSTLRAAAVDYLIKNSKQRDGTPLEHFLSNETWEHYLGRMRRDGEWGEHIILGAISEVLRCRINVLGGISGKSFTVVQPQYMSDKEEEKREKERKETKGGETTSDNQTSDKTVSENPTADTAKSDKSPSKDETNSETSQSKTVSKPATPHTCEQTKSRHTGSASLPKPNDAKVESTDTSQRKDQTAFRSKQNWDKENEELSQGEELFIGLLGEMHYVSLRKKDWEERLHEKLWARIQKREAQRKERSEEGSFSDDDMCLPEDSKSLLDPDLKFDPRSGASMPHMNYLVQEIASSRFILDYREYWNSALEGYTKLNSMQFIEYNCYAVGIWIRYLEYLPKVCVPPRFGLFAKDRETTKNVGETSTSNTVLKIYYAPNDTKVDLDGKAKTGDTDLVVVRTNCSSGFVKLCPVKPDLWYSALQREGEILLLKHMPCTRMTNRRFNENIAFACPWPHDADEWLTRNMPSGWIEPSTRNIVSHQVCLIIPVSSPKLQDVEVEWKVTFELAEEKLIELVISKKKYLLLGYRSMAFILQTQLKERYNEGRDIFRHAFFHACEQIPEKEWNEKPSSCVLYTLATLQRQLQEKHVPHYFLPYINLMDYVQADFINILSENVKIVLEYPLLSLWHLLEDIDLQSSFFTTFDAAVEDLNRFAEHRDLLKSKHEFFIPQLVGKICSNVKMDLYEKAFDLCVSAFENITCYVDGVTFQDFVMNVLNDLPVSDGWCFAFFCDCCQGTSFLPVISKGIGTTPLTTVFGSEIVHHIRTVDVPNQCITPSGVLDFVNKITNILYSQNNFDAVVVGLKAFLLDHIDKDSGTYQFDSCSSLHRSVRDETATDRRHRFETLAKLHDRLFKACTKCKRQEDYRPFIEPYEKLCEELGQEVSYYYLAEMLASVGNFY